MEFPNVSVECISEGFRVEGVIVKVFSFRLGRHCYPQVLDIQEIFTSFLDQSQSAFLGWMNLIGLARVVNRVSVDAAP